MTPAERRNVENRYREVQRGVQPVNDDRLFLDFVTMPMEEMASMSEGELYDTYRPKLDDTHWASARNEWRAAREQMAKMQRGEPIKPSDYPSLRTLNQVTQTVAADIGIIPTNEPQSKWRDEQYRRYQSFLETAQEMVNAATEAKGSPLTNPEINNIVNELGSLNVVTGLTSWYQTPFRRRFREPLPEAALLPGEQPIAVPYADIPPDRAMELTELFERVNARPLRSGRRRAVDQEAIGRAYLIYRQIENIPVPDRFSDPAGYREYINRFGPLIQQIEYELKSN
jgi:hypothetical protein